MFNLMLLMHFRCMVDYSNEGNQKTLFFMLEINKLIFLYIWIYIIYVYTILVYELNHLETSLMNSFAIENCLFGPA